MTAVVSAPAPAGPVAEAAAVDPVEESRRRLLISTALALPVGALSTVPAWQFTHWQWIALTLTAPVVVWGAWPFHKAAGEHLRHGTATVDTPVSIGTPAALGWSLYALLTGTEAALYLAVAAGGTVLALTGRYFAARVGPDVGPADRVAAAYTAVLVAVAVGTLGFWLGSGGGGAAAVGVLILAGTGALGLATPAALAGWPRELGPIRRVDTVVVGAGALTSGMSLHSTAGADAGEALRLAGAVGQNAPDPVSAALRAAATAQHGELPGVSEFDDLPGLGIRGLVSELDGEIVRAHAVLVGRPALLVEHGVDVPHELADAVGAAYAEGTTPVVVAWDGTARAVLALTDTVRPGTVAAVARLRKLRIRLVLVTGVDAPVAARLAAAVGIDPADAVTEPVHADGHVVVVGDGSPDALADLPTAVTAIGHARRTLRAIRWNLGLAVAPTAAALPVAAAGQLSPAIAGLAMLLSAGFVAVNSLRLRAAGATHRRPIT